MRDRIIKLKAATIKKPYLYSFVLIFLIYIIVDVFVNKVHQSLDIISAKGFLFLASFVLLFILVPFLVATCFNLVWIKFKELKALSKVSGLAAVGAFGGFLGGACPSCFVGLFPAFMGLFGITLSLGNLPFYGLEIQLISVILLFISIFLLTRDNVCNSVISS